MTDLEIAPPTPSILRGILGGEAGDQVLHDLLRPVPPVGRACAAEENFARAAASSGHHQLEAVGVAGGTVDK